MYVPGIENQGSLFRVKLTYEKVRMVVGITPSDSHNDIKMYKKEKDNKINKFSYRHCRTASEGVSISSDFWSYHQVQFYKFLTCHARKTKM